MRFGVGHTVVVCRPDQVREAAVVASCLPSDRLTPIVAVEPSPVLRDQQVEWYQLYRQVQQQMQSRIGTPLGMAEVVRAPTGDVLATMDAHHSLSARLAPYRSWVKRNEMVSTIAGRPSSVRRRWTPPGTMITPTCSRPIWGIARAMGTNLTNRSI